MELDIDQSDTFDDDNFVSAPLRINSQDDMAINQSPHTLAIDKVVNDIIGTPTHSLSTLPFMNDATEQTCNENMYWTDCGIPFECNPTCVNPNPPQDCFTLCKEGCFCNEGYIFSDNLFSDCILIENCSEPILCDDGYVELWGECYTITYTIYLDLSGMGLSGDIPSEIGNLTNLIQLDLGGNQLSGEIPAAITTLTNLLILDLGGNQLTGSIPAEIGNLTNLTELELGGNQLSGEIPSEMGDLNNLTFLHLEYNQLSGEIPDTIGNLTKLTWLNLIHNQLSGEIPASICNLAMNWSDPNYFNIYENQLCPPYPACIEDNVGNQDISECVETQPGDGCVTQGGKLGFLDCLLECTPEEYFDWLGDGWCDEGPWRITDYNCEALSWDCGDCNAEWDGTDPSGLCSEIDFCDLHFDNEINILDVVIVINCILENEECDQPCMDYNQDDNINILDIITMVNIILD